MLFLQLNTSAWGFSKCVWNANTVMYTTRCKLTTYFQVVISLFIVANNEKKIVYRLRAISLVVAYKIYVYIYFVKLEKSHLYRCIAKTGQDKWCDQINIMVNILQVIHQHHFVVVVFSVSRMWPNHDSHRRHIITACFSLLPKAMYKIIRWIFNLDWILGPQN